MSGWFFYNHTVCIKCCSSFFNIFQSRIYSGLGNYIMIFQILQSEQLCIQWPQCTAGISWEKHSESRSGSMVIFASSFAWWFHFSLSFNEDHLSSLPLKHMLAYFLPQRFSSTCINFPSFFFCILTLSLSMNEVLISCCHNSYILRCRWSS